MIDVLHLEDNLLDHQLVTARLNETGLDLKLARVDNEASFRAALDARCPDLILADFSLPQFDGLRALKLAQEVCPQIPFIIVSGAVGEITAVEILKSGATDYVLKDHLERLVPAVRRALREADDRRARQHAEQATREARDQAEAANRAKDHFLAVLSHELRTPLTPTLTALQTMELDSTLPGEVKETVEMIRRNVELEVRLIDDLLDLTRIGQGKMELSFRRIDAHETVRQVLAICDPDLRGKSLAVKVELNARQAQVRADPARLHQILWNILKNAVKFTEPGGQVTVRTQNLGCNLLEIQIIDTGIGMEPSVIPKIFDAFEQGGKQITQQFGGMGLGLAISRMLAEQHGGILRAFSPGKGRGSTFSLRLPVTREPIHKPEKSPVSGNGKPLLDCRVLLVEDHADTARAMGKLLNRWGCSVQTANSVSAALKAADVMPFDLVISDIGLPDGSGLDLMRQLRSRRPVRGIAISGFGMENDIHQSQTAGFSEHLVKPVDLKLLEAALGRLLDKSQKG